MEILLNKNRTVNSVNKNNRVNIELSSSTKLLSDNDIREKFDLLEEYNIERDYCTKSRLIINISPYMSNPLFNRKTEILKDEGSNDCKNLLIKFLFPSEENISKKLIDAKQAIRDTEYSHPELGNLTYHCGIDIFNNHMLRSNSFKMPILPKENEKEEVLNCFNSIFDYERERDGSVKTENVYFLNDNNLMEHLSQKKHLYAYDDIEGFYQSFKNRKLESNGWHGFKNPSYMQLYNKNGKRAINKLLNNNKPFEFIDFYPDRSLFSFIPKENKFKSRNEYNWNYRIAYPFENDKENFNKINDNTINAIEIIKKTQENSGSGSTLIQFQTKIRHNLKLGDTVKIYYQNGNDGIMANTISSDVIDVGDISNSHCDKEHFFSVKIETVSNFLINDYSGSFEKGIKLFFKKIVSGCVCEYYFRKFKVIDDASLMSGRNAFSQTIFGDNNIQLLLNDGIDVYGIKDNRGRELTEIYLNIEKTNRGYKEWYENNVFSGDNIEFSHCFGKITSGLDLPYSITDYNVHKIHNIDINEIADRRYYDATEKFFKDFLDPMPANGTFIPEALENEINEETEVFLGDIVEYLPSSDKEVVIEKVYHRFNTAQRECAGNKAYYDLFFDVIKNDDYGYNENGKKDSGMFEISEINISEIDPENGKFMPSNLAPEGYYYNPLYRIELRKKSGNVSKSNGQLINFKREGVKLGKYVRDKESGEYRHANVSDEKEMIKNMICVKSPKNFNFCIGDKFLLYDRMRIKDFWGKLEDVKDNVNLYISFEADKIPELSRPDRYNLIMANSEVPEYASYLNNTEQIFVWRETMKLSELGPGDELYNVPFANGYIYIEKNIPFFLRRQDPFGKYGVRCVNEKKKINILNNFVSSGEEYIPESVDYVSIKDNAICS